MVVRRRLAERHYIWVRFLPRVCRIFFALAALNCCVAIPVAHAQTHKTGKASAQKQQAASESAEQPALPRNSSTPNSLSLPPDEQYLLLKLQIERELQDNIMKWAQTRFWILAAISVVIGFFGVRSLVREMLSAELKDAMRASAEANAAAAQGKEAVKEVRAEAAKYGTTVERLSNAAVDVDRKFREVSSRIEAEGTRSVAAAELKIGAVDKQLAELRTMVELLAKDSERTKRALGEFEKRRAEAKQSAADSQAEFDSNAQFSVIVVHHGPGSATEQQGTKIIEALSHRGFKASLGTWSPTTPIHSQVDIDYKGGAEAKAHQVADLVSEVLRRGPDSGKSVKLAPMTGDDDKDIRVFL